MNIHWAVVVAQLAEWLLLTCEEWGRIQSPAFVIQYLFSHQLLIK